MSDPGDWTASQLAAALDRMRLGPLPDPDGPGITSSLARLDEAAVPFCARSARVAEAYPAFTAARRAFAISPTGHSAGHWPRLTEAAGTLAAALRDLGELRITRCPCGAPLDASGSCPGHWGDVGEARPSGCGVCGRDTCTCGTCGGTGKVRLRRGGGHVQDCPHCARRVRELRVLELADALDPADDSLDARALREAAHSIQTDYDPEERDRVIWGGGASPWVGVHPRDIDENGRFRGRDGG